MLCTPGWQVWLGVSMHTYLIERLCVQQLEQVYVLQWC
jgi:hypothetical protein